MSNLNYPAIWLLQQQSNELCYFNVVCHCHAMWHTGPQHSIIGIETDTIPSFFFLQSEDMFLTDLILRHHPCGWTDSLFILCETFDGTSLSNEHHFTNCSFKLVLMNTSASEVLLSWINSSQHCMHNDPSNTEQLLNNDICSHNKVGINVFGFVFICVGFVHLPSVQFCGRLPFKWTLGERRQLVRPSDC